MSSSVHSPGTTMRRACRFPGCYLVNRDTKVLVACPEISQKVHSLGTRTGALRHLWRILFIIFTFLKSLSQILAVTVMQCSNLLRMLYLYSTKYFVKGLDGLGSRWWHPWIQPPLPMYAKNMPDTWIKIWWSEIFYFWTIRKLSEIVIYIALNASFSVKNAPKSLAAGALPQTPLGKLTALPIPPSCDGLRSRFDDTPGFSSHCSQGMLKICLNTWVKILDKCLRDW